MVTGPDSTHAMRPDQADEVDALLRAAFGKPDEAELVKRLRADGDLLVELVKPWDGCVAGYAALSRMRAPIGWACLAPVAVLPRLQRGAIAPPDAGFGPHNIGTRLVGEIAASAGTSDELRTIVVLGDTGFYSRAGFSHERVQRLSSPYGTEHTLIARPGEDVPEEELIYAKAFEAL
ncbi:MAG: N-acetyltransferase [Pseudomonadota bacterium]